MRLRGAIAGIIGVAQIYIGIMAVILAYIFHSNFPFYLFVIIFSFFSIINGLFLFVESGKSP